MIRSFIFLGLVLIGANAQGQLSKSLQFREEIFDFGTVNEEGGSVMHEFVFTNVSGRPTRIISVQASCGCTTPDWSKAVVAPGKTGFIQASFNPKGRPGYFNKTLTVIADAEQNSIVLQIKGTVSAGMATMTADFPVANGNWKLKSGALNLGKVFKKDEFTVKEFQFVNGATKPVTFDGKVVGPAYIKVDVVPKTLAPGAKGTIKIGYNGKLKNQYGFQSDNIEISTDDELIPIKSFSVYATLEDYFQPLSQDDLAKAPQLRVSVYALDFGRIEANGSATREVPFTNAGKKELLIKSVQGNCTCVVAKASKTSIKPGETSTIKITFTPQDRSGTQQKAVTIFSNDPQNPVQRITFSAYAGN